MGFPIDFIGALYDSTFRWWQSDDFQAFTSKSRQEWIWQDESDWRSYVISDPRLYGWEYIYSLIWIAYEFLKSNETRVDWCNFRIKYWTEKGKSHSSIGYSRQADYIRRDMSRSKPESFSFCVFKNCRESGTTNLLNKWKPELSFLAGIKQPWNCATFDWLSNNYK